MLHEIVLHKNELDEIHHTVWVELDEILIIELKEGYEYCEIVYRCGYVQKLEFRTPTLKYNELMKVIKLINKIGDK